MRWEILRSAQDDSVVGEAAVAFAVIAFAVMQYEGRPTW